VPVVDRAGVEDELLAHQIEQRAERLNRWGDEVALDTRDRRLGGAGAGCELALSEPVPAAGFAEELSSRHGLNISDLMYRGARSRSPKKATSSSGRGSPVARHKPGSGRSRSKRGSARLRASAMPASASALRRGPEAALRQRVRAAWPERRVGGGDIFGAP
jgi:hypothetical protein